MAVSGSVNSEKPIVSLTVNVDDIVHEVVDLLKLVHGEIESIAGAVTTHMNESMDSVSFFK